MSHTLSLLTELACSSLKLVCSGLLTGASVYFYPALTYSIQLLSNTGHNVGLLFSFCQVRSSLLQGKFDSVTFHSIIWDDDILKRHPIYALRSCYYNENFCSEGIPRGPCQSSKQLCKIPCFPCKVDLLENLPAKRIGKL